MIKFDCITAHDAIGQTTIESPWSLTLLPLMHRSYLIILYNTKKSKSAMLFVLGKKPRLNLSAYFPAANRALVSSVSDQNKRSCFAQQWKHIICAYSFYPLSSLFDCRSSCPRTSWCTNRLARHVTIRTMKRIRRFMRLTRMTRTRPMPRKIFRSCWRLAIILILFEFTFLIE